MLKYYNNNELLLPSYDMEVTYRRNIIIEFSDVFKYLIIKSTYKKIVFIDPAVLANQVQFLDIESIDPNTILIPTNIYEANKDFDSLKSVLDVLEANGVGRRNDIVFAIGGGSLLDTVALAASIYRRGISIVKVPTTLLGIVDASIGIKTGINFHGQRNRLGSYHFDYHVIADPKLMKGLHKSLIRQGLGEIFKIAVIKSRKLFDLLCSNKEKLENLEFYESTLGISILNESIKLMLEELHENPREDNLLRCVDYGHSFSPLVEMESLRRTGFKALSHGYAVAYDCILTATIAYKRKLLNESSYLMIVNLFNYFDFDFNNDIYNDTNLLWASFIEMTKHRGGNQNLPIPVEIGNYSFLQDVTFEEMENSARSLRLLLNKSI